MGVLDRIKQGIGEPPANYEGIPRFTITMVGASGSGKTVFMHALFQLLKHGNFRGHNVMGYSDTNDTKELLQRNAEISSFTWTHILDKNEGELKLPEGTSGTTQWTFSLTHEEKAICIFDWVDYRGGLVSIDSLHGDGSEQEQADAEQLRELLKRSDGLLFFVDSTSLFYFQDDITKKARSGIVALEEIMGTFAQQANEAVQRGEETPNRKGISIILAKADSDLLTNSIASTGNITGNVRQPYAELIKQYLQVGRSFNDILLNAENNLNWKTAITPVGAFGHGRTTTTLKPRSEDDNLEDYFQPAGDETPPHPCNSQNKYFSQYKYPAAEVAFTPPNPADSHPSPVNAFSPLLWVVDQLLQGVNARGLEKDKVGLLKGLMTTLRGSAREGLEIKDPTTTDAVNMSITVPLERVQDLVRNQP